MEQKLTLTVSRMEGTSNAKCRLWRLRLFVDGKPAKSKRFHGTYGQAKAAGDDFKAAYAETMRLSGYDPDMTFAEYAERWLQRRRDSGSFENQTIMRDERRVAGLCKVLGGVKVCEITRPRAIDALAKIKAGAVGGRKIMNSTLINYHTTLKQIMDEAERDELIAKSPMSSVKAPKTDAEPKNALLFDDYMGIVDRLFGMADDAHAVGIALIAMNGLRRSEAVALDWEDDLGNGLRVDESVENRTGLKKKPKSPSGRRTIPMSAKTRELLDLWRPRQAAQLALLGIEQTPDTPVLTNAKGGRLAGEGLYSWWKRRRATDFGTECTVHELRHTFLTYLAKNGDAFALKRIAGWAKIAMADVYVHADDQADREAMAVFEQRAERYTNGTKEPQHMAAQDDAKQPCGGESPQAQQRKGTCLNMEQR